MYFLVRTQKIKMKMLSSCLPRSVCWKDDALLRETGSDYGVHGLILILLPGMSVNDYVEREQMTHTLTVL